MELVTLAVPRPCVRRMVSGLLGNCTDFEAHRPWRWIVHADRMPLLEKSYPYRRLLADIRAIAADHFDELALLTEAANAGHVRSVLACLREVRSDYLYLEDDKAAVQPFTIAECAARGVCQVNLQARHGHIGHTNASWCRRGLAAELVRLWPAGELGGGFEARANALLCRGSALPRRVDWLRRPVVADVGMEHLCGAGLVRRFVDGAVRYERAPAVAVATYIGSRGAAGAWFVDRWARDWTLSLGAYRPVVYADKAYRWLEPGFQPATGWRGFVRQARRLAPVVLYINPFLGMDRRLKHKLDPAELAVGRLPAWAAELPWRRRHSWIGADARRPKLALLNGAQEA